MVWTTPLVGRVTELQRLRSAASRARAGHPSAVFLHGEPGVGKTRLVADIAGELERDDFRVLRARGVRFTAQASSYLPITEALGSRLDIVDAEADAMTVLHRVSTALGELMASGPVAVVIDDVQWADLSSLDVLTYVIAGFAEEQPLLLLGTYRDTELEPGNPLHGWLADLRRMPEVTFLPLHRFDRRDTELMAESVMGVRPTLSLVEQAFRRSDGNAYMLELLLGGVDASASRLPSHLPGDLREALLASWHRLSAPTRELMQLLAIGGGPVDIGVLQRVAASVGLDPAGVVGGVTEATAAGLATADSGAWVWFRHPLVAEVLVTTLLAPQSARWHAQYASVWLVTQHVPQRLRTAKLALHCEAAGDVSSALRWSLHAAEEERLVRGYAEESRHLGRACRLWPQSDGGAQAEAGGYVALLSRAMRAAHRAGDIDDALRLGERAYELARLEGDPLASCRVLNELNILRLLEGSRPSMLAVHEAVTISGAYPSSPEHVRALAELAVHEQQHGIGNSADHAAAAVALARGCGSDEALAHALFVGAGALHADHDALEMAEEALSVARSTGNAWLIANAAYAWSRCLLELGRGPEAVPLLLGLHADLAKEGAPHEAAKLAITAADLLLWFGDWDQCRYLLREAMVVRTPTLWSRWARLTAAELAVRSGQASAAREHLSRAEELGSGGEQEPKNGFVAATVDVLVAEGSWREAMSLIVRDIASVVHSDTTLADDLMVRAAAVTADVMQLDPRQRAEAAALFAELGTVRAAVNPHMFEPQKSGDPVPLAYGALYRGHRIRALQSGSEVDAWGDAVQACDRAGMVWEAAHARYRLAAALLAERRSRGRAAAVLREALRTAVALGAEPLRADVQALALQAHVGLEEPVGLKSDQGGKSALPGLTKREQEVLGELVAGRTYSEIAKALFISEKTVSAHVSHLLQKTGTANRMQLSALARHLTTADQ